MTIKLGVIMDPIDSIHPEKDTTLALLLEAKRRNWQLYYMEQKNLFIHKEAVHATSKPLTVKNDQQHWYTLGKTQHIALSDLDVIIMRKDPPVDAMYVHTTQLLELVEKQGTLIVNKPQSLRDANEKLFTAWFPECCIDTLVTCQNDLLRNFIKEHQDVILKPLNSMGGESVFRVKEDDPNIGVIIETITEHGQTHIMAQRYIPDIKDGDKRVFMIAGKPLAHGLARMPQAGETRANIAAGGKGVGFELSERDYWICEQVGPTLKEKGLLWVGLDIIGDYLTEINVTSPTCIREVEAAFDINIAEKMIDAIEETLC